jgi:hypothetical protein
VRHNYSRIFCDLGVHFSEKSYVSSFYYSNRFINNLFFLTEISLNFDAYLYLITEFLFIHF